MHKCTQVAGFYPCSKSFKLMKLTFFSVVCLKRCSNYTICKLMPIFSLVLRAQSGEEKDLD